VELYESGFNYFCSGRDLMLSMDGFVLNVVEAFEDPHTSIA
jgi:hypothetical protein